MSLRHKTFIEEADRMVAFEACIDVGLHTYGLVCASCKSQKTSESVDCDRLVCDKCGGHEFNLVRAEEVYGYH